jgi:hypothetical protein
MNRWSIESLDSLGEGKNGNDCKESKGRRETEVLHAAAQPLQDLRTAARVPAQVRHVPLVLPRAGAAGRTARRVQVFVVNGGFEFPVSSFKFIETETGNLKLAT